MTIENIPIEDLKLYENNPRKNDNAVKIVVKSIKEFGFKVPLVIDKNNVIICGHTRYKAAQKLGLNSVPCIIADDLTPEQIKAFRLVDNKASELATWDLKLLGAELNSLTGDVNMAEFCFDLNIFQDKNNFRVEDSNESYQTFEDIARPKKIMRCPHCGEEIKL